MKKHSIELSQEQRQELEDLVRKGSAPARKIQHAQVLLKSENGEQGPNWSDAQIQEAFGVSEPTIWRIRRRFLDQGLSDAIERRRQPERPYKRKLLGEQEAHLLALTCAPAPEGFRRWSLRLLANKLVDLGYVEHIDRKTVWNVLKKTNSSPG
jgi:hypothetical protein